MPITSSSQVFQTTPVSKASIIGFIGFTSKAMKDHEIDNTFKINKIDSTDNNEKKLWPLI